MQLFPMCLALGCHTIYRDSDRLSSPAPNETRLPAPTFRVSRFRGLVDHLAIGQNRRVQARMTLGRGRRNTELNRAVAMVVVVPIHKPRYPLTGFSDAGEGLRTCRQRMEAIPQICGGKTKTLTEQKFRYPKSSPQTRR
jgi:hypothetical protein